jgi:hypothetical protein
MTEIERSIRHIAEEVQAVREQLVRADLMPDNAAAQRWAMARRLGWAWECFLSFFYLHDHRSTDCRVLVNAPRPD